MAPMVVIMTNQTASHPVDCPVCLEPWHPGNCYESGPLALGIWVDSGESLPAAVPPGDMLQTRRIAREPMRLVVGERRRG